VAWVAVRACELARALSRHDLGEGDDAPLDLRDGLLRDDDHVCLLQAADPARRLVEQ
jgi:hypothetical protein